MTRDELLQELAKTKFCAVPTVQTYDMGIEFDFVEAAGAGTVLGSLSSWPLWRMRSVPLDKFAHIQAKLEEGNLTQEDIAGTDLLLLYKECPRAKDTPLIDFFEDLRGFEGMDGKYFWCLCDTVNYVPEATFYHTREAIIDSFHDIYCSDVNAWDEYDDGMLEDWLRRFQDKDDLGEFPICCFEFNEEEND